ncbi:MAG TPA: LysM domain-containing protein [Planctomycetaceae bacterium]|jgi:hypothetical protein|nr:LysM domain-containing protein [Planctomycetaceae bacterium]
MLKRLRCAQSLRARFALAMFAGALSWFPAGCNAPPFHSAAAPVTPPAATTPIADSDGAAGLATGGRTDNTGERALYHQVRAGETLDDVAGIYGLTASRLLQVNGLEASSGLQPGQLIYIPRSR